jgi:hypothetical protein
VFESAELTVAEDELTEIGNETKTETEALFDRYGLIPVVSPTESPIITKKANEAFLPFSTSYMRDEEQEQVVASNTGGGLDSVLVNHPTSIKRS